MTSQAHAITDLARPDRIHAFLNESGWGDAQRHVLAGDASARRYDRLTDATGAKAVLMDADPARGEDVRPFLDVAAELAALGLSAPKILASDTVHGLLLLEDLGDALFARIIEQRPAREADLYEAATDLLIELHRAVPSVSLPRYGPREMAPFAALSVRWYRAGALGQNRDETLEAEVSEQCLTALQTHAPEMSAMVLRDYHSENLLWLPDRAGISRVGLLDFQDAALGHPAYDLVSLLCDARRDVTDNIRIKMTARFAQRSAFDPKRLDAAAAVLGAQRNLRILGVFARLSLRDSKTSYVDLIPRVWAHLRRDLSHPACQDLRPYIEMSLPDPTPAILDRLRAQAGKCQTP